VVAATAMAVAWPLTWRDHPALGREVASPSTSCSRREGLDEATMEWIFTMVLMLEHQEQ
jgi:hypothetical protein